MNDRDHFAAAALTGLLTRREYDACEFATACEYSYRYADAMLRERERTNHDAAPAAIANADRYVRRAAVYGGSDRTDKAAPRPSDGTGDTPGKRDTKPPRNGALTDAEREAIEMAAAFCDTRSTAVHQFWGSALRGLLERTR